MNTIKHIIIITLALLPVCIMAQTQKAFINAAEKSMAEKNYHGALVYFNEALSFDDKDANLRYKTAEAARQYGAYDEAAKHYRYLLDTLKYDGNHEIAYRLGEVHQKMGEYESSKMYYDMYLSEYSNENPELTGRTRKSIESLKKAMELVKNPDASVKITRMGDEINSPDADFAAVDRMGNMYFSSMKFNGSSKENKYKQIAKTLVKKPGGVELIGGNIQDRDMSVANFSFNTKGDRAYYSVCNYVDGWATSCQIYMADVDADGNMSNEQMANESINAAGSSNTQPNVAMVDGVEYIYFVSDRLGGEGGRDIWRVPSNGGTASNVRQVNTTADEITPFYHSGTKTLYFSSEGREGLGGFDVYKYNDNKIEVLAPPTNSSRNDMYYYLDESGTKGYLTSSRNTSTSQLESYEACCMDIYAVDIESEIDLDVLTFLQTDGSDLTGTKVCLIDEDTKKEICISNPSSTNLAQFKLLPNKNYRLIATKDGHTTATETFRTNPGDKKLVKKLYLLPPPMKLDVYTYLLPTKDGLDGAIVKLIDITDPNKPVEVIRTSKSNDFHFDILPNRQYKLVGTRDGYSQVLDMLNTKGMSGTITRDLFFQKRGMQEQLPISLYFDNDYPDPRSRSPKTGTQYNSLTDNYLARKQEYVTNFTKGLSSSESASAQVEIESFFSNDVEDGRYRFNAFLSSLEQQLAQGQSVELEIRGFASPRAKSDYNKILSERRISCIRNQMMAYGNGVIKTAFAQGKLKLIDVSFGNTQAKPNVIGDLDDERNSIYNINAARERRVEIINAIIK